MKKPQLITIGIGLLLTAAIYFFVRTTPRKKMLAATEQHSPGDGHNHEAETSLTIDTILNLAKKQLTPEQVLRISTLEKSLPDRSEMTPLEQAVVSLGDSSKGGKVIKDQQIHVYHQLARFWYDSARVFEPYAWYQAEAARLENSEKSLTFAAQLFLDNMQLDDVAERRKWKALQAKDLFERSLKINPANDSAKVGLGAAYLFGGITDTPMEGILKIREVAEKDSTNVYAQMMLAKGSLMSGQYDKAIDRFLTVCRLEPGNLDAVLLLAEVYERTGDRKNAVNWYQRSLPLVKQADVKKAIEQRINELKK